MRRRSFLVTGGAGFIGSNLVRYLIQQGCFVVVLDKLTYAGNRSSLSGLPEDLCKLVIGDICDTAFVRKTLEEFRPDGVFHLAAESHVDRSIDAPSEFISTNILGTYSMLQASREAQIPRFVHVSTDEVYGSLSGSDPAFTEEKKYEPNSPYSASKAASDHLARAWHHTYSLPVMTTNCSNNYGSFQFPEKLIPHMILSALTKKPLPVYGDGKNVRDWLFVNDHCSALFEVMLNGNPGEVYNIGGNCEMRNIDVVNMICEILDEKSPRDDGVSYKEQITFVRDRPAHDRRYAIDATKIKRELGWEPQENFQSGLARTVEWYLENEKWVSDILNGSYRIERIGTGA